MKLEDYLKERINNQYYPIDYSDDDTSFFRTRLIPFVTPLRMMRSDEKHGTSNAFFLVVAIFAIIFAIFGYNILYFIFLVVEVVGNTETNLFKDLGFIPGVIVGYLAFTIVANFLFLRGLKENFATEIRKNFLDKKQSISNEEYKEAAEILRNFQPVTYNDAKIKYSDKMIDLLIVANTLYVKEGKLKRLVSIQAIEEDREAVWGDAQV